MEEKLSVIYKAPFKEPKKINLSKDNYFEQVQELVGGYVEIIPVPGNEDILICLNEEGKIEGLDENIYIEEYDDLIVGPIVFMSDQGEKLGSLSEAQEKEVIPFIKTCDPFKLFMQKFEKAKGASIGGKR